MRLVAVISALLLCGSAFGATLGDVFIERDDCGNEILFGRWPVKKQTIVYGEPRTDSKQLAILEPNTSVTTLACEAHITPGIAQIRQAVQGNEGPEPQRGRLHS
jgi:hypothetical protein